MRTTNKGSRLLLLVVMLSLASCASSGRPAPPVACPTMPPLPAKLLKKTDYAAQVRLELYELPSSPSPSATKP